MLNWVEHERGFITSGPDSLCPGHHVVNVYMIFHTFFRHLKWLLHMWSCYV